jgi:hypothetical protein
VVVVRCTRRLLDLLGLRGAALGVVPPSEDDWYANLLWLNRRKCLLVVHAGTLFAVFVGDVRAAGLRPFGERIVGVVQGALLEEGLPVDVLGSLDAGGVAIAKTASRHVLGVMNEMAFECGWHVDEAGGLDSVNSDELNHRLRRGLHTKHGQYRQPLALVLERLALPQ